MIKTRYSDRIHVKKFKKESKILDEEDFEIDNEWNTSEQERILEYIKFSSFFELTFISFFGIKSVSHLKCLTFTQKVGRYIDEQMHKYDEKVKRGEIVEELPKGIDSEGKKKRGRKISTNHVFMKKFMDQADPPPKKEDEELEMKNSALITTKPEFALEEKVKRRRLEVGDVPTGEGSILENQGEKLASDEILLEVSFSSVRKLSKERAYVVLGSQTLADLKDAFYCISNQGEQRQNRTSGYFFIENVFYDDTRDPRHLLYSKFCFFYSQFFVLALT